jgi:hypothetical protein
MFERFSKEARAAIVGAQQVAREGSHEQIGGLEGIPALWIDSDSELPPSQAPWAWPPPQSD